MRNKVEKVISADGASIAFERSGDGPPVVVVGAALQDRAMYRPLAEQLAQHFTVFNYDRRGRGDSGDTAPYAIEREIEDIGALIAEAGGMASVYGHSSGADCPSPGSCRMSRRTHPKKTRSGSAPRGRTLRRSRRSWQKAAAAMRSHTS